MRTRLISIACILFAITLYMLWVSMNSRIVAVESVTGTYIHTGADTMGEPVILGSNVNLEELYDQLAALQVAQRSNAETIAALTERLDLIENLICRGDDCGSKALHRVVINFDHDDSSLSQTEKDKIKQLIERISDDALVSLRGLSDTVGNKSYNHLLSLRRAAAVNGYINEQMQEQNRTNNLLITINGLGEESAPGDDEMEDPDSRIVEILVFE